MGGGSVNIPQRNFTNELGQIFGQGWPQQYGNYTKFVGNEPLLSGANQFALGNLGNINQLIDPVQALLGQLPSQFGDYQKQLEGYRGQIPGYQANLQNLIGSQQAVYNELQPILQSQGALTPEQDYDVRKATEAIFASQGNATGNQAAGAELLNRDQYRQSRFANALSQALGLSGSISGLTGQEAGLTQLGAGLTGQEAGLTGEQAGLTTGLAQGAQGLQSGQLSQLLGTEQGQVGSYATLFNPLLSYASDLFSSNQNAAAAQSIAGANKSSGALGGGLSAIGTIAPIALAAFSDKRLKENIRDTGEKTAEGIPIKTFSYRGDKRRFIGALAQDVEKIRPDAVLTLPLTGHKLVNLAALPDVPFEEVLKYMPRAKGRVLEAAA